MGRPTVNPEDYNMDWQDQMISAFKKGKSEVWTRANCFGNRRISNDLWYRWVDEHGEFSETLKYGKVVSQAWWEDKSQEHAIGELDGGNATTLIFNMTNRFREDWKQRQTVESTNKISLDPAELEKIELYLKEHGVDVDSL